MPKTTAPRVDWKARHAHVEQQNQAFRQALGQIRDLIVRHDTSPPAAAMPEDPYFAEVWRVADEMLRLPNP